MVSKKTSKPVKNAAKVDTGAANKPDRHRRSPPRRGASQARSGSAATRSSSASAPAAPSAKLASAKVDQSTNTTSQEYQASQSKTQSAGAHVVATSVSGAARPRASTKRALLIGMLERPEGASVAEIGQRLGWLPHTVRAAITGLRHASREVTRSKGADAQSVYRLAPAETPTDR